MKEKKSHFRIKIIMLFIPIFGMTLSTQHMGRFKNTHTKQKQNNARQNFDPSLLLNSENKNLNVRFSIERIVIVSLESFSY